MHTYCSNIQQVLCSRTFILNTLSPLHISSLTSAIYNHSSTPHRLRFASLSIPTTHAQPLSWSRQASADRCSEGHSIWTSLQPAHHNYQQHTASPHTRPAYVQRAKQHPCTRLRVHWAGRAMLSTNCTTTGAYWNSTAFPCPTKCISTSKRWESWLVQVDSASVKAMSEWYTSVKSNLKLDMTDSEYGDNSASFLNLQRVVYTFCCIQGTSLNDPAHDTIKYLFFAIVICEDM